MYVRLRVCVCVCMCIHTGICKHACMCGCMCSFLAIHPPMSHQSMYLCMPVLTGRSGDLCASKCMSVYAHRCADLSIHPCIQPSIQPSIHPSIRQSISHVINACIYLSLFVHLRMTHVQTKEGHHDMYAHVRICPLSSADAGRHIQHAHISNMQRRRTFSEHLERLGTSQSAFWPTKHSPPNLLMAICIYICIYMHK